MVEAAIQTFYHPTTILIALDNHEYAILILCDLSTWNEELCPSFGRAIVIAM
jgi:hypothetical protein